jgi:DNA (cytosine-5)-methyltransferase 1
MPDIIHDQHIRYKISRLADGEKARVLDLFSGCGGISLGFQSAGFEIRAAVELDPIAAQTHGQNFHSGKGRHTEARDITTNPKSLCRDLELGPVAEAIDVIVGGPPCQAFARIGRAKLREVYDHPEAFLNDPRAKLFRSYLKYVKAFKPLALLIENVPDVMNFGGRNIAYEISKILGKNYSCEYTLLNAAHFGIPQMRERMFLVAHRRELGMSGTVFPAPTHCHDLPRGYQGVRAVALKLVGGRRPNSDNYVEPPLHSGQKKLSAVSAREAIEDLPIINALTELKKGKLRRGARRFDKPTMIYDEERRVSDYARAMKNWPGFPAPSEGLYDHQIRYLPRDYILFSKMAEGDQYPELHRLAMQRFKKSAKENNISPGSDNWEILRSKMVPPYDPGKFPNKWWKLIGDEPVRTLTAHLGKDGYSHIHYDRKQARTISVREAARLQSFPDGFRFCGTMNPAFRQIGNAVPPLMAKSIAVVLLENLREASSRMASTFISTQAAE